MSLARKDFYAIARQLMVVRRRYVDGTNEADVFHDTVHAVARGLKETNPGFDVAKFRTAVYAEK